MWSNSNGNNFLINREIYRPSTLLVPRYIGGNATPSQEDVKKILDSVGVKADEEQLAKLFKELEGKDLDELIKAGTAKLSAVPSGGGGGGGGGGGRW